MICCLNPACHNPPNPDGTKSCSNCGTGLVVLRNRYRPIKSLGGGGFGKTYLAEDIDKLNEHCVIKQFAPQVQGTVALNKATELFEQEAKRLQQLGEHSQIPTLLAYFEEDNRLYLVQQFINGQNLLDELKQQGIFNEQKVRELLLDLLEILKTVHQHKVIHRDIKPENIIRRSDGKLVLIDFGASKQLTMTVMPPPGTKIGSLGYAPLEQMEDGEAYPASDLYSVGATCFHLLSGIPPYPLFLHQGYTWVAGWRQHLPQPVSLELGRILDRLLQKEYQQRYQSIEEVLQNLNPLPSPSIPLTQPGIPAQASPPVTAPSQPPISIPAVPANRTTPTVNKNNKLRNRLVGGVIALLVGTQIYGYVRYDLFPFNPIFLVTGIPNNSLLKRTLTDFANDENSFGDIAINSDGKIIVGVLHNGRPDKLWNLATGEIRTLNENFSVGVFSPDGKTFAYDSFGLADDRDDSRTELLDVATWKNIGTFKGQSEFVNAIAFSPDGKILASGSYDDTIKLWDIGTGKEIRTLRHSNSIIHVAFSPDGKTIASSNVSGIVKLWDVSTGLEITTFKSSSQQFAFNPDGKTIATYDNGGIKFWDVKTGKVIRTFKGISFHFAFSPDGKTIASGSTDGYIKLWDVATEKEIRSFKGHSGAISSLAITSDGRTLVTASSDKTIKIWRMP